MSKNSIPLLMHRWFENGASWAYSPKLEDRILDYASCLTDELSNRTEGQFEQRCGRVSLIGIRVPDEDCLDTRAKNRLPFLLLCAVVKGRKVRKHRARIWRSLKSASIPCSEGAHSDFSLPLDSINEVRSRTRRNPSPTLAGFFKRKADLEAVQHAEAKMRRYIARNALGTLSGADKVDLQLIAPDRHIVCEPETVWKVFCRHRAEFESAKCVPQISSHAEFVTATLFCDGASKKAVTHVYQRHWLFSRNLKLVSSITNESTE